MLTTYLALCITGVAEIEIPDRPQYICMNNNQDWNPGVPASFTQQSVDVMLAALNNSRGSADGRVRLCLGFDFWIFFSGNITTMVQSAKKLVALVEANDIPISLSIDPTQWWTTRPDLWNWWDASAPGFNASNRYNVEWTTWDPQHNATALSWRNWGSQFRMPTPAPNFAAPAFRRAIEETMLPIAQVFGEWYSQLPIHKRYLLAYIRCTQELWVGTNYFVYPESSSPSGPSPRFANKTNDPVSGLKNSIQVGYAAICTSTPKRCSGRVTSTALDAVVNDFIIFAAGVLTRAGIPRTRLMSHTGAFWGNSPNKAMAWNTAAAAVTNVAAPGWSLYGGLEENPGKAVGLEAAIARVEGTPWGAPEWLRTFDDSGSTGEWLKVRGSGACVRACVCVCVCVHVRAYVHPVF